LRTRRLQLRFGGACVCAHLVKPRLGDKPAVEQGLIAAKIGARATGEGLSGDHAGRSALCFKGQTLVADQGDKLAAPHRVAFAHKQARQSSANPRPRIADIAVGEHG
jgi:hypothetical protein